MPHKPSLPIHRLARLGIPPLREPAAVGGDLDQKSAGGQRGNCLGIPTSLHKRADDFFFKLWGESRSSRFPLFAHKVPHKGKSPRKPHKHRTSFALSVESRTGDKGDIADGTLGADRRDPAGGTHADAGASLSLLYWCWCWCVALASKPWVTEASVASCLGSAGVRRHPTCSGEATNGRFRAEYR